MLCFAACRSRFDECSQEPCRILLFTSASMAVTAKGPSEASVSTVHQSVFNMTQNGFPQTSASMLSSVLSHMPSAQNKGQHAKNLRVLTAKRGSRLNLIRSSDLDLSIVEKIKAAKLQIRLVLKVQNDLRLLRDPPLVHTTALLFPSTGLEIYQGPPWTVLGAHWIATQHCPQTHL